MTAAGLKMCTCALSQTDSVERRSTRILNTGHLEQIYSVSVHFHRLNVQFARAQLEIGGRPKARVCHSEVVQHQPGVHFRRVRSDARDGVRGCVCMVVVVHMRAVTD